MVHKFVQFPSKLGHSGEKLCEESDLKLVQQLNAQKTYERTALNYDSQWSLDIELNYGFSLG